MEIRFNSYKNILTLIVFTYAITIFSQNNSTISASEQVEFSHFTSLISSKETSRHKAALRYIEDHWKPEFEIMTLELLYFSNNYKINFELFELLKTKTGKRYGVDFNQWYDYLWSKPQQLTSYYHKFKAQLHGLIDKRFVTYFKDRQEMSKIRLDEVRWGGVLQDGIPPLRNPQMIPANKADYLDDDNVVFGIEINGDFRAYPKRILAWHEMFTGVVGGVPVAGVYCTLCGTVILYKTEHNGKQYQLGTSGFLYRSNKLMYDKNTQSLWNTIWGKPVIGPLADKNITLDYLSVVTTTWSDWKARHPETTVLSLQTGHKRDYGEGVAYKNYFATDKLMFNVPDPDRTLKYKQSILAIRLPEITTNSIAISTRFLKKHSVYNGQLDTISFVVLTDTSGANRVYYSDNIQFSTYNKNDKATDENGTVWYVHENQLVSETGRVLKRLHSFNAFWFGWKAAYPDTKLIK